MNEILEKTTILKNIKNVEDLRAVPKEKINTLCGELREMILSITQKNGGHLASNLGVVELTLALHRVFDTPNDHLIWDVGHQSYVHKMVTGRLDQLDTLRQFGGLSGFTKTEESIFDPFGAGHSSTSIAAAMGFAQADVIKGEKHYSIAVIGDGALTGGLALEALNNCNKKLPLIIVINENEMSISKATGTIPQVISRLRISRKYRLAKKIAKSVLPKIPLIGKPIASAFVRIRDYYKKKTFKANFFEELGFSYLGPYDGNDYAIVEKALNEAKEKNCSVVVHLKTKKGKGFTPAEQNPEEYHSYTPKPFKTPTFSEVFGSTLSILAKNDNQIVAISPSTKHSTGLDSFSNEYPNRFFDCGIAEEYAVTFAGGLAANGLKPYVSIYSSFAQRAYDEILHDIVLQKLNVKFIVDRASLAPGDGPTHHGIYDIPMFKSFGLDIYEPFQMKDLQDLLLKTKDERTPCVIRFPHGCEYPELNLLLEKQGKEYEDYALVGDANAQVLLITFGHGIEQTLESYKELKKEYSVSIFIVKKLTNSKQVEEFLSSISAQTKVVILEESIRSGGVGEELQSKILKQNPNQDVTLLAITSPLPQKQKGSIYESYGVSKTDILNLFPLKGEPENET